jgi:flagellar motility protein MotE (MotC chaperone)
MAYFIPPPPPVEGEGTEPVAVSGEDYLRQQVMLLNSQYQAAQGTIDSMKQQLDEKDRLIQAREDEIATLRNVLNLAATQSIASVALMYEAMDPQEAATILTELGAEQAAMIMGKMRESKAADVLALMDTPLATQITQLMSGFEANPLTQGAAGTPGGSVTTPPAGGLQPGAGSPTNPSSGGV